MVMAQCVQVFGGQLQLDGSSASSCTGYLLLTADEVTLLHAIPPLSIQDGATISGAIVGVWAVAWGFRAVARLFFQRDEEVL